MISLTCFVLFSRVASLALGQWFKCSNVSKVPLKSMCKIDQKLIITKCNKALTVGIILRMFFMHEICMCAVCFLNCNPQPMCICGGMNRFYMHITVIWCHNLWLKHSDFVHYEVVRYCGSMTHQPGESLGLRVIILWDLEVWSIAKMYFRPGS